MTDLVPPEATGAEALEVEHDQPWLRLDKRMLLIHPVNELVKLLPVLLVSLVVGSQSGNHYWGLIAVAVIVAFALLRWFTTFYRIGPVHIELRTGVFQKKLLSVPRSRIRSVDVQANVLHRVLGLSIVRIGTGHTSGRGDDKFELNALDAKLVPAMRAALLERHVPVAQDDSAVGTQHDDVEIAHFSPAWVRYAPFSSTGVVAIAAVVGATFQYGIGEKITESSVVSRSLDSAESAGIVIAVIAAIVVLVLLASLFACVRYLLAYGNLRVVDDGRVVHISHGLLKTRQTSLDRGRLRGTTLKEPLLLRLVGGGKLDAIMTGVSAERHESSMVLPQAPVGEAHRVMNTVIGDTAQGSVPLTPHGPAALRRRFTRLLLPLAVVTLALLIAIPIGWTAPWPVWAVLGGLAALSLPLAWDRYRGLGHAVLPGWLITRSGSLDRDRDCLQSDGIIGWTVRQSYFQRRTGVATVIAATPAGKSKYEVLDIPMALAWQLVDAVTPGAGDIWVHREGQR